MFDPFGDFDSTLGRHVFENYLDQSYAHGPGSSSSSGSEFYLCDDNSDSDSCSIFNSDQENNDDKVYVNVL